MKLEIAFVKDVESILAISSSIDIRVLKVKTNLKIAGEILVSWEIGFGR